MPEALLATTGDEPVYVGRAVLGLGGQERERFWKQVDSLGTPQSRLAGVIAKRKASWVKEGLFARVRHLKGEEMLRHATVKAVGIEGELPVDVDTRHPDVE
jgi:ATP-dependent DNA ligase